MTIWTSILTSLQLINPVNVPEDTLSKICNLESLDNFYDRTIVVGTSLRLSTSVILVIMFINIIRYVRSKSKDGKVPAKYGRYQRNILTMKQCLAHGLLHSILALKVPIISQFNINISDMRHLVLVSNILTIVMFDVIFPLLILLNLNRAMPDFYSRNSNSHRTSFYTTQPILLPRRPTYHEPKPTPVYNMSYNSAGMIFVVNETIEIPNKNTSKRSIPFPKVLKERINNELAPVE